MKKYRAHLFALAYIGVTGPRAWFYELINGEYFRAAPEAPKPAA